MTVFSSGPVIDVPAFTIQELTGDKRTLTLTQRALPYGPMSWSGKQRAEFTTYPGNPIKTMQVLGAEENPSDMSGFWKDRFIGVTSGQQTSMAYYTQNGQQTSLVTAIDLVALVDDIRRKGQRIVAQWGPVVRRGLLEEFEQKWHNVHDVEWTMRFEWTDQNDPDAAAVVSQDTDYANAQGTMQAQSQSMQDTVTAAADPVVSPLQLDAVQTLVTTIINDTQDFADTVASTVSNTLPVIDQQRRLASILQTIANDCDALSAQINSAPSITFVSGSPPTAQIGGPTLAVDYFNRTMLGLARDTKYGALTTQANIINSIQPNILGVFTARENTDLRDVSTTYYGTQNDWRSIMAFNGMADSTLESGDSVFVPQLYNQLDQGGSG